MTLPRFPFWTHQCSIICCGAALAAALAKARKAKADPIVCPVLAARYANGDLKCEEDGTMTREQLVEACMQCGCSRFLAGTLASGAMNAEGASVIESIVRY